MYQFNPKIIKRKSSSATLPAPIGGLNDRDSLAEMPPTDAVILENWWVTPSMLVTRPGSQNWVTGFTNPVETLAEYDPPTGASKLFAASNGGIYDCTAGGALPAESVSGLSNNRWQDAAMTTAAGNFLYLFNGADKPQLFNGATWVSVDGTSTPAITGITDTKAIIQGCVFKNRLWLVEKNTLCVWYLPIQSIGGLAVKIDLGAVFERGGSIVGMYTWTLDSGTGSDDMAVFLTSNGEVAVYSGSDPTVSTGFNLIGVYFLGRPMGRRPCVKFGGDLLIICELGLFPLSQGLLTATIDRAAALTDKIQNLISSVISAYSTNFGWEVIPYPNVNALLLNVPAGNGANYQLIQNTISKAWTKFTGWNANTFIDSKLGFFFADATAVRKAWVGDTDNTSMINSDALQAFSAFGAPAQNKSFTMVKPYIRSDGNPSILYGINGDYNPQDVNGALNYIPSAGMIWGAMSWGSMVWGGSMRQISNYSTVGGIYKAAALRMKSQNNGSTCEWAATDFLFETGGFL